MEDADVKSIREKTGLTVRVGDRLCTVHHAYSHFRIALHAYACRPESGRLRRGRNRDRRWASVGTLDRYPFSAATRKVIDRVITPPHRPDTSRG